MKSEADRIASVAAPSSPGTSSGAAPSTPTGGTAENEQAQVRHHISHLDGVISALSSIKDPDLQAVLAMKIKERQSLRDALRTSKPLKVQLSIAVGALDQAVKLAKDLAVQTQALQTLLAAKSAQLREAQSEAARCEFEVQALAAQQRAEHARLLAAADVVQLVPPSAAPTLGMGGLPSPAQLAAAFQDALPQDVQQSFAVWMGTVRMPEAYDISSQPDVSQTGVGAQAPQKMDLEDATDALDDGALAAGLTESLSPWMWPPLPDSPGTPSTTASGNAHRRAQQTVHAESPAMAAFAPARRQQATSRADPYAALGDAATGSVATGGADGADGSTSAASELRPSWL